MASTKVYCRAHSKVQRRGRPARGAAANHTMGQKNGGAWAPKREVSSSPRFSYRRDLGVFAANVVDHRPVRVERERAMGCTAHRRRWKWVSRKHAATARRVRRAAAVPGADALVAHGAHPVRRDVDAPGPIVNQLLLHLGGGGGGQPTGARAAQGQRPRPPATRPAATARRTWRCSDLSRFFVTWLACRTRLSSASTDSKKLYSSLTRRSLGSMSSAWTQPRRGRSVGAVSPWPAYPRAPVHRRPNLCRVHLAVVLGEQPQGQLHLRRLGAVGRQVYLEQRQEDLAVVGPVGVVHPHAVPIPTAPQRLRATRLSTRRRPHPCVAYAAGAYATALS